MSSLPSCHAIRPVAAAVFALSAGVLGAALPNAAHAQQSSTVQVDAQTVTVTATLRREPIRDVPLAVSRIDTEALEASGAKDLKDYVMTQPGLNLSIGGRGNSIVTMRGVATSGQSSATVGFYVDDVPVGSSHAFGDGVSAFDQQLLDLSTIEVLRGPQGTLYGASSLGGLLKYVTTEPDTRTMAGSAGIQLASTSGGGTSYTLSGVLNAPLSANVAGLRVSAFHNQDGGYVDTKGPVGAKDANKGDGTGARVALLVKPTKSLGLRISAQTQTVKSDNRSYVTYDFAKQSPAAGELDRLDLRVREPQSTRNELLSVTAEYDLGWARVSSITGKQKSKVDSTGDFSIIYSIFVPTITTAYSNIRPLTDKTTQEFRIVSQTKGAFDWLAGVFYAKEKSELGQDIFQATAAQPNYNSNPLLYGPNAGFFANYEETAVYATGTFNASPALAFTLGARASKNKLDVVQRDFGLFTTNSTSGGKSDETPNTWLLAARYKLDPTASVYARAATGYRPGGPNLSVLSVGGIPTSSPPTYKSDSLRSVEAGYKSAFGGKLGTVEASVYQIDWNDIQVIGFQAGGNFRTNAGTARVRGVDFTTTLRPTDGLTLVLTATSLDAKLTEASPIGAQTAKAGSRLPYSARVTANASARYDFQALGRPAFAALAVSHVGDRDTQFEGITSARNFKLPAFTQVDLNGGVEFGSIKLGAFVRNLTDERGLLNMDTSQVNFGGPAWASLTRPRTFGVTLGATF